MSASTCNLRKLMNPVLTLTTVLYTAWCVLSGVMPLIFASSLLGLPLALARLTDSAALERAAESLGPGGALYLPVNVALIAFFNYYYTFLQVRAWELAVYICCVLVCCAMCCVYLRIVVVHPPCLLRLMYLSNGTKSLHLQVVSRILFGLVLCSCVVCMAATFCC
eukprot:GHUV01005929.1.p1 GENE.GHUV01005929.1~~GHUV01005929.1.p1  ORF type:complete len:165 (-),score=21.45 GHUV01005929.1:905-1399(-)